MIYSAETDQKTTQGMKIKMVDVQEELICERLDVELHDLHGI
jgi:hypothetical protein